MEKVRRVSLGRILAFATGDFYGGGTFNLVNFLYPGYIVLAVGMPPYMAGIIMMVARVFDAVIDPPLGLWSDKLRVRFGTRRGSLFLSAPLVVLGLLLMFFPYNINTTGEMFRFWAALLSYLFYCLVQSSIMIPYWSLSSELTDDYTERARLTTVRLGFSIFSSIICVALPGMIVDAYEGTAGYIAMSLVFGSAFMICILVTALFAKEGIPAPKKTPPFLWKDFVKPFKLRIFRQYMAIYLCCQMTMAIMSALFFFYVDFYFSRDATAGGESTMVGLLGAAIMFSMQIVALPIYMAMIKKSGKMRVYIVGSAIWILSALVILFVPANSPAWVLYMLAAVMGFGISGPGLIPHAMFGDIVDVGHLKFGVRDAGAFSGISSFVNTCAQGMGLAIVMSVIGAAGFTEQQPGAELVTSQPESAQTAIIFLMALAPLALMSIGIYFCFRYRLNKDLHAQVISAIESENEEDKAAVLALL
jgi:oligogalacturonide transporter